MSPAPHSLSPVRSHLSSHPVASTISHSTLVLPSHAQVIISTSSSWGGKLVLANSEQSSLVATNMTTPVNLSVSKLENTASKSSENRQLPVKHDNTPSELNHCPVTTATVSNLPRVVSSHAYAVTSTPHSQGFAMTTPRPN